jgi:hypothetical protein
LVQTFLKKWWVESDFKARDVKPVKGTFKLHVVAGIWKSEVFASETSCYCYVCLEGGICDGWRKEGLGKMAGVNGEEIFSTALKWLLHSPTLKLKLN